MRKILSVLFTLALILSMTTPVFAFEDKDCSDFSTWEEAQRFFEENGGPAQDPHRLDGNDKDGLVCESLPGFNPDHVPGSFVGKEPPKQDEPPATMNAKVVRVIDGDTIEVELNGKKEDVRFILIDTPETKHPQRGVEPCGPEASAFTAKMLPAGTTVKLELDVQERDKYGRLLAYVYVGGKSVQKALLAEGLAKVAVYPPNVKYVDEYRAIEAEAKKAKKGIWSDNPCGNKGGSKPDDGKKDDGDKVFGGDKGSGNKGGTITPPKSGSESGGQTGGNAGGQTGGKMPKTATPYPTMALVGGVILVAGVGLLRYRRRAA